MYKNNKLLIFWVSIILLITFIGFSSKAKADNNISVTRNSIADSGIGGQRAYVTSTLTWVDDDSIPLTLVFSDNTTLGLLPRQTATRTFTSNQTYYIKDYPNSTSEVTIFAPLRKSNITYNQISLSWGDAKPETGQTIKGYDIYRDSKKIGSTIATSFKDTGLKARTNYTYYIQVNYVSRDNALKSNTLSVSTNKNDPPTVPTDIRAAINTLDPASTKTHLGANLSWTESIDDGDIESYLVYSNGVLAEAIKGSETRVTISNLDPGKSYQFYVVAKDTLGQVSAKSQTISLVAKPGEVGMLVNSSLNNKNTNTGKSKTDKVDALPIQPEETRDNKSNNQLLFLAVGTILAILMLVGLIITISFKRKKAIANLSKIEGNQPNDKIK